MIHKSPEERLASWSAIRKEVDRSDTPLVAVAEFWSTAPLVIYNYKIDQFNPKSWPTPWDIIVENKYDDFTLALMIGLTLKLTHRFALSKIEVRTMVDSAKTKLYNLVYVDDSAVLNFDRSNVVNAADIDPSLYLESSTDVLFPR